MHSSVGALIYDYSQPAPEIHYYHHRSVLTHSITDAYAPNYRTADTKWQSSRRQHILNGTSGGKQDRL